MELQKIQEADVENKRVLLRVDFNVSIEDGKVKESFKISSAKETVDHLLKKNAKVALVSHFGRPDGKPNPEFSLGQIVVDAEKILGIKVRFIDGSIGEKVREGMGNLANGEVLLLENVRFYPGDESNDEEFSRKLSEGFDIFVNDAFSASHRNHASVTGVMKFLPSYAGIRLQKEAEEMEKIKENFNRPAVAVIGGAKIETKLPVIKFFEGKYDHVLVGGKIANEAIDQKIEFSEKVILPVDNIGERMDIGPKTIEKFQEIIAGAKTIVWNGPLGKFEDEEYSHGTQAIFEAIMKSGAFVLAGGGETLEVLEKNNAMEKISFVSTGGGAMLEYLGGKELPGIEALKK